MISRPDQLTNPRDAPFGQLREELACIRDARWKLHPIAPKDTGLCEAFAERMDDRFGWTLDPRRVEILSEVVQGMYVALEAYSGKGDGVVVQTPIYPPFLSACRETDRRLVENRLLVTLWLRMLSKVCQELIHQLHQRTDGGVEV